MTPRGRWLTGLDLYGIGGQRLGVPQAEADVIWRNVSQLLVSQASGQVRSVLGRAYRTDGGFWRGTSA